MTGTEIGIVFGGITTVLNLAGLVVGLGVLWGKMSAELRAVKELQTMAAAETLRCRSDREATEDGLHGRITATEKNLEYLKGRFNGHGGGK